MIDKNDVIAFFDMCAPTWDAETEDLGSDFDGYLETTTLISDELIYQICGKKKILLKA